MAAVWDSASAKLSLIVVTHRDKGVDPGSNTQWDVETPNSPAIGGPGAKKDSCQDGDGDDGRKEVIHWLFSGTESFSHCNGAQRCPAVTGWRENYGEQKIEIADTTGPQL
jgi:hypothetical protein